MAAAAATSVHKVTHAHDRVDDTALYGCDEDYDFFGYVGDVSDGGEDDGTYDANSLHPDPEEQMSSSPDLLVSLIPDRSHEHTSLANASTRVDALFAHIPCTDVLLPVALRDLRWTTGTESSNPRVPREYRSCIRAAQALVHGHSTLVRPTT